MFASLIQLMGASPFWRTARLCRKEVEGIKSEVSIKFTQVVAPLQIISKDYLLDLSISSRMAEINISVSQTHLGCPFFNVSALSTEEE